MENKSIHSKAAGILRKVLTTSAPESTPKDVTPTPADPAPVVPSADETIK